ncbi:MAG: ISKra4 family transposase [Caldilineaceae bacterium]
MNAPTPGALCASTGFFPLDAQLELASAHWSSGFAALAVRLAALLPFAQAAALLQEAFGIPITVTSLWRHTQQLGQRLQQQQTVHSAEATALPQLWERPVVRQADRRMGVALDGAILNVRGEGWKEVKLGCVFDVGIRLTADPITGELLPLAQTVQPSYVAHLGGPEQLGSLLRSEARRRQWERAGDTLVLGDGAPWIWNQAALHFPDSQQLVDWYHAKAHLAEAAKLLKGEGTPACTRWFNQRTDALYQGHAATIAHELQRAAAQTPVLQEHLNRIAGYFATHSKRMNYLEQREAQWPIGSGVIESAAKQFKARMCGAGMRWSRTGAETMLLLRAAVMSRRLHLFTQPLPHPPLN